MFLVPNFLGGELPEFLESIYKIDAGSDHVAKFRGDRPRELGDLASKKENITSKIEDLPYYRTGRSNNTMYITDGYNNDATDTHGPCTCIICVGLLLENDREWEIISRGRTCIFLEMLITN